MFLHNKYFREGYQTINPSLFHFQHTKYRTKKKSTFCFFSLFFYKKPPTLFSRKEYSRRFLYSSKTVIILLLIHYTEFLFLFQNDSDNQNKGLVFFLTQKRKPNASFCRTVPNFCSRIQYQYSFLLVFGKIIVYFRIKNSHRLIIDQTIIIINLVSFLWVYHVFFNQPKS